MIQKGAKSRRFGDFTYREIHACAQQGWLAIIPTGCTEQQGPHLPVDFARYSSTGVIGDPTHASAELGKRLWEAAVEEAAQTFKRVAEVEL